MFFPGFICLGLSFVFLVFQCFVNRLSGVILLVFRGVKDFPSVSGILHGFLRRIFFF